MLILTMAPKGASGMGQSRSSENEAPTSLAAHCSGGHDYAVEEAASECGSRSADVHGIPPARRDLRHPDCRSCPTHARKPSSLSPAAPSREARAVQGWAVVPWLGSCLQRVSKNQTFLINITYHALVQQWKNALASLDLPINHGVLYQLRHAGPSHDRCYRLRSVLEVKQRGRWNTDSCMKRYEAHARISQEFHKLPATTQEKCLRLQQRLSQEAPKLFHQLSR